MSLDDQDGEPLAAELTPRAPDPITTRSQLLRALEEACELEHGLLVQYLFAACTIRTRPSAEHGIDEELAEYGRRWKRAILLVAHEEMMHLGLAANLLAAVGGRPRLRHALLPSPHRYFPHEGKYVLFTLRRLSVTTTERFLCFERPEPASTLGASAVDDGDAPEYRTVGQLYRGIEHFIEESDEATLFIGSPQRQETSDWKNPWFHLERVKDAHSALRAISRIISEGEGTPVGAPESHYGRFRRIRDDWGRVPAARLIKPVAPNPYLRHPAPQGDASTALTDPGSLALADLFNRLYFSMVLMLELLYAFTPELADVRGGLRNQIRRTMSGLLRPLAEVLTDLPAGDGRHHAGPPFELPHHGFHLADDAQSALVVVSERLGEDAERARTLVEGPLAARPELAGNVELLASGVALLRNRLAA
jgi:hypothetical protein